MLSSTTLSTVLKLCVVTLGTVAIAAPASMVVAKEITVMVGGSGDVSVKEHH